MSEPLFIKDQDSIEISGEKQEFQIEEELTELLKADNETPKKIVNHTSDYEQYSSDEDQDKDRIPVVSKELEAEDDSDTRINKDINISLALNLQYQQEIVQDLVSEDGLVILGQGLGLNLIVANLLHILSLSVIKDKKSLILLINASDFENFMIGEELMGLSWLDEHNKKVNFMSIGGDATTVDKRRKIYDKGGILSISNRILVTDLLGEIIDANLITGLVVLHAERIKEYSTERFIINLYRRKNKWGFIKALSDDPEGFTVGFQPLYTKMKYLKIDRALLWPRFHVDVTTSLRSRKLDTKVTEVSVKLTRYMTEIQKGLIACIEACISELKRHNPELATEYWTMENALDRDFVKTIRATLDPAWHRVSHTSKQVLYDLTTLKTLLSQLFTNDPVQFYQDLDSIEKANRPSVMNNNKTMSPWLLLDDASTVTSCARARIFHKVQETSDEDSEKTLLLEELPKWEQLALILDDINNQKETRDCSEDGPILIMCSSYQVCGQLRRFLISYKEFRHTNGKSFSARKMMVNLMKQHLNWKKNDGTRRHKMERELNKKPKNQQLATENGQADSEEITISRTFMRGKQPPNKRRRNRGGSTMASYDRLLSKTEDLKTTDKLDDNVISQLESNLDDDDDKDNEETDFAIEPTGESDQEIDEFENFLSQFEDPTMQDAFPASSHSTNSAGLTYEYIDRSDQIVIEKLDSRSNDLLLSELLPSYIILYEPNLKFIRNIEIYQSQRQNNPAKCFFMYYGGSIEEQNYLNAIKKEKDAFTKLIREKANMSKTFTTEEDEAAKFAPDMRTQVNTRIAGGNTTATPKVRVIVDIREFRSQLPFLCYLSSLEVIPCMITVGDYILSPKICVERKSIPDLIGSLKSGRLYQQCEQMFRYYELPTLLIEFEEGKSFSLEPFTSYRNGGPGSSINSASSVNGSNYQQQDLQLKLMMLLVSFPSLKIVWSSSPFETARLFKELKMNQDEPDLNKSINAGLNPMFDKDTYFNDVAIDLLQNIPGITSVNCHLITNKVKSLKELSVMSEVELAKLIGNEAASKVVAFFKRKV